MTQLILFSIIVGFLLAVLMTPFLPKKRKNEEEIVRRHQPVKWFIGYAIIYSIAITTVA